MIAITSLLVTITLSMLVTRVAAMALMLTGLSRDSARFQARSAFTGVGFTTAESESIARHPARRQIIMTLMLLGNVGIATFVATIMISIVRIQNHQEWLINMAFLLGGIFTIWVLSKIRWLTRQLNKVIAWALKRFTKIDARDYVAVLNLQQGYAITEMRVHSHDWLADKSLIEASLPKEGVLILGIQRNEAGAYIGAPTADTVIQANDTLVLYGPIERLDELDKRRSGRKGDRAHREAVTEHAEVLVEQKEVEKETANQSDIQD